jgi:transposase InsO family protein
MELTKLQIKPLSGLSDWPVWKRKIRDFLDYHDGTLDVIDGKLTKPEILADGSTAEQRKQFKEKSDLFRKANSYAKSMITSSLTEETYQKVMDKETAREVWEELRRNFEASSKDQLFRICADFFSFSWTLADDVSTHVAKLRTLWNEFNNGLQAKSEAKLPDMMLICKILHILPSEYQSFKSSWMLLADEKQSVEELVIQLCSFERDIKSNDVSRASVNSEALVLKTVKPQKQKFHKSKLKGLCNYCHEPGHWVKSCSKWIKDGKPKRNSASGNSNQNSSMTNVVLTVHSEVMQAETNSDEWFVDNGATKHVTNRGDIFVSFEEFDLPHTVTAAGGESIPAIGKGTVEVWSSTGSEEQKLTLTDVWYVPKVGRNLFSVLAAQDKNPHKAKFMSTSTECWLTVDDKVVVLGTRKLNGTLYRAHIKAVTSDVKVQVNAITDDSSVLQLYHERFGHQNRRHVQTVIKRELGIDCKLSSDQFCENCIYGKAHRLKFGTRKSAVKPGEIISADVCGPFDESFRKYRYYVVFKDHYSKLRFICFLRNKSEVVKALREVLAKAENDGHKIKEVLSDGGGEFDNEEVRNVLRASGITQRLTAPYTPEQNGAAERDNRTIVEMARTLKYSNSEVEYPAGMWAELCQTAVYILNRTSRSSEEDKTPFEVWTGRKPRIKHLRVIGSVCYVHVPASKRRKMDKKAIQGYLVGYDGDERYRIYIKEQHKVILSRDVIFQEKIKGCRECVELPMSNISSSAEENSHEVKQDKIAAETESESENELPVHRELRNRSCLEKPKKFNDYVTTAEAYLTEMNEPECYEEAVNSKDREHWIRAMNNEMESLAKNQTWEIADLPEGAKAIPCKWVFKLKTNADGSVERFKARLVAKGFNQREGIDYSQTFSPVARLGTIRSVLSIAASERMYLKQFDVSTAFLYGQLNETVYMQQPEGYSNGSSQVCRLKKSLYGLKQAPRCWNKRIETFLVQQGFKVSDADPCLYVRVNNNKILLLALYVDDGLLAATDMQDLNLFISRMKAEFEITVKEAAYFLGIEIEKLPEGSIKISQTGYTRRILERFGFNSCKAVATPMVKLSREEITESGKVDNKTSFPYRQAIGALMFLMIGTRPDLAYSVGYLSRVLDEPSAEDIIKVKRLFRYLAGTVNKGILYRPDYKPGELECYSDADFGGCAATGRSTSGVVILYAGGAVTWLSQRQVIVATSTTESEIIAASEATKEIIWLKRLFCSIVKLRYTPILQVDNSAAIKLAQNPEFHRRTKHIDIKYFFVREKVIDGSIDINQISTEHQVADIMTKPLDKGRLSVMCSKMGLT